MHVSCLMLSTIEVNDTKKDLPMASFHIFQLFMQRIVSFHDYISCSSEEDEGRPRKKLTGEG